MRMYFIFYVAALLMSMALTAAAVWVGKKLNLTDPPGLRKVHREPIPRIGGVAIYMSVALVVLSVLLLRGVTTRVAEPTWRKMSVLALGASIVFLIGVIDDIITLRARVKLLAQLAIATLVCAGGICIEVIGVGQWSPIPLGWLAWPITILWIVGITNAINLIDGVDGLATSVSMIACGVIAMLAITSNQLPLSILMLAMLGALTGFLWFNFSPASIFLGDSGSLFLGFVIGSSSIVCFAESGALAVLALPAVALGIPILDTLLTILRRFIARRPIFAPDRSHFHHKLLQLGLGHRQLVGVVCFSTLLLTWLGTQMLEASARTCLALCGSILMLLLALFYAVGVIRIRAVVTGLRSRLHLRHEAREEISEFCNLQLLFDQVESPRGWWQALCSAAGQLECAWISLGITDLQGNIETYLWRRPETPSPGVHVTVVKVPMRTTTPYASIEVEVAVLTNGSVESAIRRASLLGRLIDEYEMPVSHESTRQLDAPTDDAKVKVTRPLPTQSPIESRLGPASGPPRPLRSLGMVNSKRRLSSGTGRAHRDL